MRVKLNLLSHLVGVFQDLFVISQLLLLSHFFGKVVTFICLFFLYINVFFDAYLYRKTGMRMETSFFSFLDDLGCFWDSAKERGFFKLFPKSGVLLLYLVCVFMLTYQDYSLKFLLLSLFVTGLIGIGGALLLGRKISYLIENIFVRYEKAILGKLRIIKKGEFRREKQPFHPENETFEPLDHEYPLLKKTEGFYGEKQFNLRLKKGEKPHVIFLFMESFRGKNIGALNGEHAVSPNFDALAKEGILFRNFYANSVKTSRAVTASLFGIPSDIASADRSLKTDIPLISLAEILNAHGYHSSYLHNGPLTFENQDHFFSHHGFETVLGKEELMRRFPEAPANSWGIPDEYLMQYANGFLKKQDRPQFLTMFTITNHHPWTLPSSHQPMELPDNLNPQYSRFLQTFRYSDEALGSFVKQLRKDNLSENVILFILADHGQPMGEHDNNFMSQKSLYEENMHIPLLILADGRIETPLHIDDLASQVDLLPTLMDLFGIQAENHSMGHSLMRKVANRSVFFHNPYVHRYFGMRKGKHKFIYTQKTRELELYNLINDPIEKHNIAYENPDVVTEFLSGAKHYEMFFKSLYREKRFTSSKTSSATSASERR